MRTRFALAFLLATYAALASSCDKETILKEPEPVPDSLIVTATSLSASLKSGSDSSSQALGITSRQAGMAWTAVPSASWLTLSSVSGVTPAPVTVTAKSAGLAPGNQTATITITAPTAANSPRTVSFQLTVTAPPPQPKLSATAPSPLEFSGMAGDNFGTKTIQIANTGTGTLNWSVFPSAQWITATPTTGANAGTVTVGVNTQGMPNGVTNGQVIVSAPGATNSPISIPVKLTLLTTQVITATVSPANAGTVTGAGTYTSGTSVTLQATANAGYQFVSWTENGNVVSNNASYTFTVTGDRNLVANFQALGIVISATVNPAGAGVVTGTGVYESGATVTLTALPNSGVTFLNWTENNNVVSTNSVYTFTATADRALVANFSSVSNFTVSITSDPAGGGTTTGAGSYAPGTNVTVTATPNAGFSFVGWYWNGILYSTSTSYTFTINENRALVAKFQ